MRIGRRTLLIGASALAVCAAAVPVVFSTRQVFARILARHFSTGIARHPETDAFLDSFVARWQADRPTETSLSERLHWARDWMGVGDAERLGAEAVLLRSFVRETTVVRAEEANEDLLFLGPSDPLGNPCANPLSSYWL